MVPVPRDLTSFDRVRLAAGTVLGDAAAWASRRLGRGSGASIRGQILTRVQPDAFRLLLRGRRIAAVTGTNGKTTSTHLLAAAVREGLGADAARLVTNADGANLHYGIASALAKAPKADTAVLETDERVVADMIAHGRPEVLVLLNFSRDQLDRNHEIKFLGRAWRDSLTAAGDAGPVVIANSDDPLVTWAAGAARRVIWVDTASTWVADAALCPNCGDLLTRENPSADAPTGRWDCPGCDLTEPQADYVVRGDAVELPDHTVRELTLNVPGKFNVSNAAMALAAAVELGVPVSKALTGFRTVRSPAGRFAVTTVNGVGVRLVLSKNPAGWAESLPLLETPTVVLAIDSVAADGKDVSWLWDVEFEQLRGKKVICTGPRAYDLAVRLAYAEVEHEVSVDLTDALRIASIAPQPVDLIATYTPFQKLLKMAGLR
ncbi:MurT ligase domain-containing protein [Propioniciclava soli]|uniref:MurT ligase domain-containing protein n=1 Tax=Propioniciclava soli TaxID=2775081 RepID=UPI0039F682A4